MCSSESHVIPISKKTFKATANDFCTLQKICIFTDNLFFSLPLHFHLASSNRTQYSYVTNPHFAYTMFPINIQEQAQI